MQDIFGIVKRVADDITPSRYEKDKLNEAVQIVKERMDEAGIKFEIGGSYARDTWLAGDADIDFFMIYPPELGADSINAKGMEDAENVLSGFPHWKRYAEHPYLEGKVEGVTINLVPCADVKQGNWITSMDRSRFHTIMLNQLLNDELRRQIRVLKSFLKANGIYGAEVRIGGFSGYVTEILTIKYGSFIDVLKAAKGWKKGTIISLSAGMQSLAFNTPIIIIDPVDSNRNLAAAIKPSNVAKFQLLAGKFLDSPTLDLFKKKATKLRKFIMSSTVGVVFKTPKKVEEIRWSEYMKTCEAIFNVLDREGFEPLTYSIYESKGWTCFTFLITFMNSNIKMKIGPPVEQLNASLKFMESNSNIFIKNDMKVYSVTNRRIKSAHDAVKYALKRPIEVGIARGLMSSIKKSAVITYSEQLRDKEYLSAVKGSLKEIFYAI